MYKNVLITGASGDIGSAIAREFAKNGFHLYLTGFQNKEALLSLEQELKVQYGIPCQSFMGDISDYHFVTSVFSNIPSIDIVINNAGISYTGLLSEMSFEDWHRVIDTNLSAAFYTSKLALPLMLSKKQGKIINISSVWGNVGASIEVAYSASKGGLNAFTKALAKELAPSGIQVNAIACGMIDTKMNRQLNPEEFQDVINDIPADRAGLPTEVAQFVLQLSQSPTYLTGQVISLDGGWI